MPESSSPLLVSLGYGKRSIEAVLELLRRYDIQYLVDVRSSPWSRYHPEFAHDRLKEHMQGHNVAYLYMGKELGGRPEDPTCYDADGRVDYAACMKRTAFRHGIDRLCDAWRQGRRLALLCAEGRAENCHRSRLIGVALSERGIEMVHIDDDGSLVTQRDIMLRLSEGQLTLFADAPPPRAAKSKGKHRPAGE